LSLPRRSRLGSWRALALLGLLLSAFAFANDRRDAIFKKFDHAQHERTFQKAKVTCMACHEVGGAGQGLTEAQLADVWMHAPASACHECHALGEGGLGSGRAAPRSPRACAVCHDYVPSPETHVAGWTQHHGADAVAPGATCRDCHARSMCVDCHDRREDAGNKAHDPSWLTIHAIVARADPASCDTCHVRSECTSCHDSAGGFGRSQ
jgi:hypothetical protein